LTSFDQEISLKSPPLAHLCFCTVCMASCRRSYCPLHTQNGTCAKAGSYPVCSAHGRNHCQK
jgi:hypothetical protein